MDLRAKDPSRLRSGLAASIPSFNTILPLSSMFLPGSVDSRVFHTFQNNAWEVLGDDCQLLSWLTRECGNRGAFLPCQRGQVPISGPGPVLRATDE